jgi:uncharacterized membrane protein YeaQ/YmgE (transglycosylase-associated protein family)
MEIVSWRVVGSIPGWLVEWFNLRLDDGKMRPAILGEIGGI